MQKSNALGEFAKHRRARQGSAPSLALDDSRCVVASQQEDIPACIGADRHESGIVPRPGLARRRGALEQGVVQPLEIDRRQIRQGKRGGGGLEAFHPFHFLKLGIRLPALDQSHAPGILRRFRILHSDSIRFVQAAANPQDAPVGTLGRTAGICRFAVEPEG